jgi:hypothetical protein
MPQSKKKRKAGVGDLLTRGYGYSFPEYCFIFGGAHRDEFLEQIEKHFIAKANETELAALSTMIRERRKARRSAVKRGRPTTVESTQWFSLAVKQARQRHVLKWTFQRIAKGKAKRKTVHRSV